MHLVSQWLVDNKLSLHLSILFGSKHRIKSNSTVDITCNGTIIEPTSSIKYLGASIDQTLSFDSMARCVLKKANARLKYLYRKKNYLTQHTKKLLVMALIQCYFDYACTIWYNSLTQSLKNKLQTTQNKLMRFVLDLDARSHIGPEHFKSLNWLPVIKRVDQIILCHVFKVKNGLAPDYMGEQFIPQDTVHSYGTRSSHKGAFGVPKVKGFGLKSFFYSGISLWNKLPASIAQTKKLHVFKTLVKKFLLDSIA